MLSTTVSIFLIMAAGVVILSQAQQPNATVSNSTCNGVLLTYSYISGAKLPPTVATASQQPYSFKSTLTVLNNGLTDVDTWQASVGFRNQELLVSATNAVLADGTGLPASVGNGTVFAGYPQSNLKTAVETAGDLTQMEVVVSLVGTQFGVAPPRVPMPANISLANDGWICPNPTMQGTSQMQVCCTVDPKANATISIGEEFLPRQKGDLTIMYDVIQTSDTNYWAQVTISNHNNLGRLDDWNLSWEWMNDEFIFAMKGAYPSVVDTTECIFGKQGQYYQGLDFSQALNCERRPTIIDLPLTEANDTTLGKIPYCCRNGTILPPIMDPTKSISAFQINVNKMPPNLNRSQLSPPQNWQINGTLNPTYVCGPPVRVSPSLFPNPSGLPSDTTAVASWQVVCNITQPKGAAPKCCVSFSAYYNESIIPCSTCACGCQSTASKTCSPTTPALLLPSQALLVPFDNRTLLATAWASINHQTVPNPLPCGDNCGVSINWNVLTDYNGGWTSRVTLFNWDETSFADWFLAVEMNNKTALGFQKAYSFNDTMLSNENNTIFLQGVSGFNYLVAEVNATDPSTNPPIPGKQQSVLSFTKKTTPGINVPAGDGFPTRVLFNGEECSLPTIIPTGDSHRSGSGVSVMFSVLLALVVLILMQW